MLTSQIYSSEVALTWCLVLASIFWVTCDFTCKFYVKWLYFHWRINTAHDEIKHGIMSIEESSYTTCGVICNGIHEANLKAGWNHQLNQSDRDIAFMGVISSFYTTDVVVHPRHTSFYVDSSRDLKTLVDETCENETCENYIDQWITYAILIDCLGKFPHMQGGDNRDGVTNEIPTFVLRMTSPSFP